MTSRVPGSVRVTRRSDKHFYSLLYTLTMNPFIIVKSFCSRCIKPHQTTLTHYAAVTWYLGCCVSVTLCFLRSLCVLIVGALMLHLNYNNEGTIKNNLLVLTVISQSVV